MASTQYVDVWTANSRPGSNSVFFQPWTVVSGSTTSIWQQTVLTFNDSTALVWYYGRFKVPAKYENSTANAFLIDWTSTTTTGNRLWFADYRAFGGDNSESYDSTSAQQSTSVTDAAPGAAARRLLATIAVSSANFAAGDTVLCRIGINGANASDTHGSRCHAFSMHFRCQVST